MGVGVTEENHTIRAVEVLISFFALLRPVCHESVAAGHLEFTFLADVSHGDVPERRGVDWSSDGRQLLKAEDYGPDKMWRCGRFLGLARNRRSWMSRKAPEHIQK
jgi:hypothetical protein